jgi:hypothetical protein
MLLFTTQNAFSLWLFIQTPWLENTRNEALEMPFFHLICHVRFSLKLLTAITTLDLMDAYWVLGETL